MNPGPMNSTELFADEEYFLSRVNPTATADQLDIETRALEMLESPIIKQAREQAAGRFRIFASGLSDEQWAGFEDRLDEWVFHYTTLALNSDPNHPRVLGHGYGPPHEWFGHRVPGCRGPGTAENPDCNYSYIPVDGQSHYELHVKVSENPVGDLPMWVCANTTQTINTAGINWEDVTISGDGTFVVTIGPEPSNGSGAHLQTTVDSKHLFIRDCRQRWDQIPNAYRIVRVDPPARQPLTADEQAALAHRYIIDHCASNFGFAEMFGFMEPNSHTEPMASTSLGGMPTQKLMRGRLKLDDEEAYVLTTGGNSEYFLLVSYDLWLMSGNFWDRTSSLNNLQSRPNEDGTYTYVFSNSDPGVHNWIHTNGHRESLFLQRWQLLPQTAEGPGGAPWARGEVVRLADLDSALPPGTQRVDAAERERQIADRLAAFKRRHVV